MKNFKEFGLHPALVESLERMRITIPTPVQLATIPVALEGHDLLASAQTGTGKTVAYVIPLIMKLLSNKQGTALILAPTRELAMQVQQALNQILGSLTQFKTVLLIGGAPIFKQIAGLRKRPQIIIGTPGRVNDHLMRRTLVLQDTRFLIIDEADRMLDMGFGIQLDQIAEYLPETRQTLMFSATFPPNIDKLAKKYLRTPQRIAIDANIKPNPKIKQEAIRTKGSEKWSQLLEQLNKREGSIIIFVRTKRSADRITDDLQEQGHNADAMHGDLPQRRRAQVIQNFRSNKSRILVATDVAARGLDIPHVMHVINYDLPECPEDYVHRIGRTGRADAEGFAVSFITPDENYKWKAISRLLNPEQTSQIVEHGQHEKKSQPSSNKPMRREDGFFGKRRSQHARKGWKKESFGFSSEKRDDSSHPFEKRSSMKFKQKKRPFFKGPRHAHSQSQAS